MAFYHKDGKKWASRKAYETAMKRQERADNRVDISIMRGKYQSPGLRGITTKITFKQREKEIERRMELDRRKVAS